MNKQSFSFNKMSRWYLIICVTLFLTSCSKDQISANKLEGKWTITDKYVNGSAINFTDSTIFQSDLSITFDACKLNKDDSCVGHMEKLDFFNPNGGDRTNTTTPFSYIVSDNGETVQITISSIIFLYTANSIDGDPVINPCSANCVVDYKIVELTDTTLILEGTDSLGDFIRFETER